MTGGGRESGMSDSRDKKPAAIKIPKFLKKTLQADALKAIAGQLFDLEDNAQASSAGPSSAPAAQPAPQPQAPPADAALFHGIARDRRIKVPGKIKKTNLDYDALRKFARDKKEKAEERIKWELEFRNQPADGKPPCPIVDFLKASECPVKWDEMTGRSRVRYCERCSQRVYDLAGLGEDEAKGLVATQEGHSDLSYYRRNDGKFLVADCPLGSKRRARLKAIQIGAGAAVAGLIVLMALDLAQRPSPGPGVSAQQPPWSPAPANDQPAASAWTLWRRKAKARPLYAMPLVPKPQTDEDADRQLLGAPARDESGVLSHPYVSRPAIIPKGGYPSPGASLVQDNSSNYKVKDRK